MKGGDENIKGVAHVFRESEGRGHVKNFPRPLMHL